MIFPRGDMSAPIAVLYGFPTADDAWKGVAMSGAMGEAFFLHLSKAGIMKHGCFIQTLFKEGVHEDEEAHVQSSDRKAASAGMLTIWNGHYVSKEFLAARERLIAELQDVSAKVFVVLDAITMFALTGVYGAVDTWRGSRMAFLDRPDRIVIPTYPMQSIQKRYHIKPFGEQDLRRAASWSTLGIPATPEYNFIVRPTFRQAIDTLDMLLGRLEQGTVRMAFDIETIRRQFSCTGIAWSNTEAICLPFCLGDDHYWEEAEEIEIMLKMREIMLHPNTWAVWQNGAYDLQYYARYYGFIPKLSVDTMLMQHVLFPGIPKSLDFLASMYCQDYTYWKDENKDYNKIPENLDMYWTYNCKDTVKTFECSLALEQAISASDRETQARYIFDVAGCALKAMLRGVHMDSDRRRDGIAKLENILGRIDRAIADILGFELNTGSTVQMKRLCYEQFKLKPKQQKKTGNITADETALLALGREEPLLKPLFDLIIKRRSLSVFLNTFYKMPLDDDSRMRCSFNAGGTETFRFSSSANAFGSGGNLQNIPKGEE